MAVVKYNPYFYVILFLSMLFIPKKHRKILNFEN